ncbi:MAG TPA: GntR family transcriptional regulator [Steroidobacter sp.]
MRKRSRRAATPEQENSEHGLSSQRITDGIRQLILSGELRPGSRVRQEELADRFGTSRLPVREALRKLESEGLIVLVPNSSAWVAKLDLAECVEVYKIREAIDPLAIAESVRRITDAEIATIEEILVKVEQSTDTEDFLRFDREFHLACYAAANMPRLRSLIERFWNTTQHYRRAFMTINPPAGNWTTRYEHRLLLDAIKRRDAEGAAQLLRSHIRRTRMNLESHLEVFADDGNLDDIRGAGNGKRRRRRRLEERGPLPA